MAESGWSGVAGEVWMSLGVERLSLMKRVRRTLVRAVRMTQTRDVAVDEALRRDSVVVERVPMDRVVESVPPVREEGDTIIVPVVAEELVVVRRLVLKEEVRLRRVAGTAQHTEIVSLREQVVSVTRTGLEDALEPMDGKDLP